MGSILNIQITVIKYSKLIFKIKQILITSISGKGYLTHLITVGILWDHVGQAIQQTWQLNWFIWFFN